MDKAYEKCVYGIEGYPFIIRFKTTMSSFLTFKTLLY